jgi:hypothetical protein
MNDDLNPRETLWYAQHLFLCINAGGKENSGQKTDGKPRVYRNNAAANAPNIETNEAVTPDADPVKTAGPAVVVAVVFAGAVPGTMAKLAQVILVVFAK